METQLVDMLITEQRRTNDALNKLREEVAQGFGQLREHNAASAKAHGELKTRVDEVEKTVADWKGMVWAVAKVFAIVGGLGGGGALIARALQL